MLLVCNTNRTANQTTTAMKKNLERIRLVTENFHYLKGLLSLPLGFIILFSAGGQAGWWSLFIPGKWGYVEGATLLVLIGLYWWISRYYHRTFGRVEYTSSPSWKVVIWLFVVFAAVLVDGTSNVPVNMLGLAFAGIYFAIYTAWKERIYYLVFSVVLAIVSLLPLLPGIARTDALWGVTSAAFAFTLGAGILVIGVLDHLLLVRTLPPAPDEESTTAGEAWSHA